MNNQFVAKLKEAEKANDVRQAKLVENFNKAVDHEADILGCDRNCFKQARRDGMCPSETFIKCCNDGVVRIDFTEVNTAAIIERQYGDAENLSSDKIEEINSSLKSLTYYERKVEYRTINGRQYQMYYEWNYDQSVPWNRQQINEKWERISYRLEYVNEEDRNELINRRIREE